MRQILLNNKNALLARMPRPAVSNGCIVVKVRYSMISPGTELAGLRQNKIPTAVTPLQKAKAGSSLAVHYLAKAIQHPKRALRRVQLWASVELEQRLTSLKKSNPLPELIWQDNLAWSRVGAPLFSVGEQGLQLQTDESAWGYQAWTEPLTVPAGHTPVLELQGHLAEGKISIGLLNADRSAWLGSKVFPAGQIDERLLFPTTSSAAVTVVITNAEGGAAKLSLNNAKIALLPPDPTGLPHSEQGDTGWNVGYSAVGQIMAVGEGVTGFAVGDWVACAGAGRANHADYISVPQNLACQVPAGCDLPAAASTTLGTIALQGVRRADPKLGEIVVVLGLGLLGQITAQILRANGCQVIGLDLSAHRAARAREAAGCLAVDTVDSLRALVRDQTQGRGADRTLITAATSSNDVLNLAMAVTRRKGVVVIVGDVGLAAERQDFYRKEIDLLMSTSYGPGRYDANYEEYGQDYPAAYVRWTLNRNMQAYLALIANQQINVTPLIDRIVPIEQAPMVYSELANQTGELPLGVVLEYTPDTRELADAVDATLIHVRGHRKNKLDRINYVLVGAGAFGTSMLVPQLEKFPEQFFLRGIVSNDNVRGGNFARQHGLEIQATELATVLDNPDIHLLVIATRHSHHAAQVIAGLKAGKHVFVEKPLALTWEELHEIDEVYQQLAEPPLLMVGFNRRFSPAMQQLKAQLSNRRSPLMINYRLNGRYIPLDHWVQTREGGGRNIGEACHIYDCFRFLTGAPVSEIQVAAINPGNLPYLRNDNFTVVCSYSDGSVATLTYTALGPKQGLPKERVEVFCDGEAFVIDDYKNLLRASDNTTLWSGDADKGHFAELQQWGSSLSAGGPSPLPFVDIIETTALCLYIEDLLYGRINGDPI